MCSRYESPELEAMAKPFMPNMRLPFIPFVADGSFKPVVYPGYNAPVIIERSNGVVVESRFWGNSFSRPHKRDPKKKVFSIYQNAKSETVERVYAKEWNGNQRCLIPVKRFWEPLDGVMTPIVSVDAEWMGFAGFWGQTVHKDGPHESFNMLTCKPNKFMTPFHGSVLSDKRMPVIIQRKDWEEYLSIDTPPDQALKLCMPYRGDLAIEKAD